MLVNFNVFSLFTKIPLNEAIQVINDVTEPEKIILAKVYLR
jgi:hypothetical protein